MNTKSKILFSHSYFLRFDPKQWALGLPYAPIGTLYAAAVVRNAGYSIQFFDNMFAEKAEAIGVALENYKPDILVLYDDGFNYLTKMCLSNMREAAFTMIKLAKNKNCQVIVSSSDATDHHDQYLDAGADFVITGEGEQALLELVESVEHGSERFTHIPGLAFKKDSTIVRTNKRPVMKDLDALPFPAWDLVDMKPYKESWLRHKNYFSINLATTRGCPFKCNWCAKPIYGNRYNCRSPQNVVDELKLLKEQYGYDHVWFCDDIFGLKPGWVKEFAACIAQNGLQIRYKIQSRADLLVQDNYVRDLAASGCESVWMGAESGSQKILDAMDKGTTIPQIYEATSLLKKHKIRPCFFIQFGYPGETKEDIAMTIQMIRQLKPAEIGISVSYPLPGTVFYENVKNELIKKSNWTDSDDLALMFHNTYSPAFYKRLHRYVHKTYRIQLALQRMKQMFSRPGSISLAGIKAALSVIYYAPATWLDRYRLYTLEKTAR